MRFKRGLDREGKRRGVGADGQSQRQDNEKRDTWRTPQAAADDANIVCKLHGAFPQTVAEALRNGPEWVEDLLVGPRVGGPCRVGS
jgi:hypothetical protein